jgi:nucleoside-diphosphate-sugar epimerase
LEKDCKFFYFLPRQLRDFLQWFLELMEELGIECQWGIRPLIAGYAQMYAYLEQRVLESSIEGVALRYGFFYGPTTWYDADGGAAYEVRQQQFPVIEGGEGKRSFVHIEDAAHATVAALTADPGKYVVVDNDLRL